MPFFSQFSLGSAALLSLAPLLVLFSGIAQAEEKAGKNSISAPASPVQDSGKPLLQQKWWTDYRKNHYSLPKNQEKSSPVKKPNKPARHTAMPRHVAKKAKPKKQLHRTAPASPVPASISSPPPAIFTPPQTKIIAVLAGQWHFDYEPAFLEGQPIKQNTLKPPQAITLNFIALKNGQKNSLNIILNPLQDDVLNSKSQLLDPPKIREDAVLGVSQDYFSCKGEPIKIWFENKENYSLGRPWCETSKENPHLKTVMATPEGPRQLGEITAYNQKREELALLMAKHLPIALSQGNKTIQLAGSDLEEVQKFRQASSPQTNPDFFKQWQQYWLEFRRNLDRENQELLLKANAILARAAQQKQQENPTSSKSNPALPAETSEQVSAMTEMLKGFLKDPKVTLQQSSP